MQHSLLVTELVDSSRLTEELGDEEMARLWAAHDRVARDLLGPHRGREITKTNGFLILFQNPADAVRYALAYHDGLASLNVKARAGLHVGPAVIKDNSPEDIAKGAPRLEIEGMAKPIAARVMSIAIGGQTLLTAEARDRLDAMDLRVESHGFWRMKGVAEPVEVFEIGNEGSPFCSPPDGEKVYRVVRSDDLWLPVKAIGHNLPRERDAFVGRRSDLMRLAHLLDNGANPVTVLGIGGTGKTRFANHYGWTHLGDWPGGIWFCDLSEARDQGGIIQAVARALGVPLGREDPVSQLGYAISGRGRCLVVLDNFEQLTSYAETTLGRWVDMALEASFLITSRQALGLGGEETLELAPLSTKPGVELFSLRAVQAKHDFKLEEGDREDVESLVELLDGLPLAIELAAARVRLMPPSRILSRMSQRFKLIASSGVRARRHSTLRNTLDWSWELLSLDEQSALAQLSVFEGGFTAEAAEAVLSPEGVGSKEAVLGLAAKSLVRRVSDERFNLLLSVQEYAAEKLEQSGEKRETERRHGEFHARFGSDDAIEALDTHGGVARRRSLSEEFNNVIAACRRACARSDAEVGLATLQAAWAVLLVRGPFVIGRGLATSFLQISSLGAPDVSRASLVLGQALHLEGRHADAQGQYETALSLARDTEDLELEVRGLRFLALLYQEQGRLQDARHLFEEAILSSGRIEKRLDASTLDDAKRTRAHLLTTVIQLHLNVLQRREGRLDETRRHYESALILNRQIGDRISEGVLLGNLGSLALEMGRYEDARSYFDAALAVHREAGNRRSEAIALGNLGNLLLEQERRIEARECLVAALSIHREVGNRRSEAITLGNLGSLKASLGSFEDAHEDLLAALTMHREVRNRPFEAIVLGQLGGLCVELDRLDDARSHLEAGETLIRDLGDPIHLGILLCHRAHLEIAEGRIEQARSYLSEAEEIGERVGPDSDNELGREIERTRTELEGKEIG